MSLQSKNPRHIEAEMHTTIGPIANIFSDETLLNHGSRVGEMQLEDVAAGFDVESDG